jgi:hypothetical protein
MQIAYVMPSGTPKSEIMLAQRAIDGLRPDQRQHVEHLLKSWRKIDIGDVRRAIKRAICDRP